MGSIVKCSRGHQWEISDCLDSATDSTQINCPICGEASCFNIPPLPKTLHHSSSLSLSSQGKDKSDIESTNEKTSLIQGQPPSAEYQRLSGTIPNLDQQPSAFPSIPGYEIMNLCGRGGMGVVFRALQVGLNRLVALKMIHAHVSLPPEALTRFRAEAQAVAQLQHPNIVQIFEIGEYGERPYFTLEYVEGGSLSARLRRSSYSPRQAAQLVETLARAVHYAHEQGIVHRDLKPGNILLAADGSPKITDFGLAKRLESVAGKEEALTKSGEVLGTPSYMAPEQAAGDIKLIGRGTDIYSLGAILYELLTGQPPFEGDSPMQTALHVIEDEPTPPRDLQPKVPRDLQTICLKCLRKQPQQRYASAEALANDLGAYLAGGSIQARPLSQAERIRAMLQRQPWIAAASGVGLLVLLGLLAGAFFYSTFAVGLAAMVSALVAGGWYSVRLQRAYHQIKEQNLNMERNVERLHLLLETTQQLMKADSLDELLRLLSETTTSMVNAERATVFLLDPEKRELWSKVALGDNVGEIRVSLGSGVAGTVAVTGAVINMPDAYADPRFNPEIDRRTGYKTRNMLTFPMRAENGEILGVFQVLNKRNGSFEAEDEEFLAALARCAAVIVSRAPKVQDEQATIKEK